MGIFKKLCMTSMLGVMLAVPTYATVVTGSQSDVNMELKYPLVYTNNMFAQRQLIQTLLTMFYTQNQFITINMHIK